MYARQVSIAARRSLAPSLCVRFGHGPPGSHYDPDAPQENPLTRCKRFLKRDLKDLVRTMNDPFGQYEDDKIFPKTVDIVIVGGGVIGSSIAYWIQNKCRDGISIAVIEKDLSVNNKSVVSTQEVL